MLLTIENIENKLIEKFSPFQGEMDDLILKKRTSLPSNIDALEKELEVNIDGEFLSFISKYELDNFSLGNIAFGVGSDYINTLIKLNKKITSTTGGREMIGRQNLFSLRYQTHIQFY